MGQVRRHNLSVELSSQFLHEHGEELFLVGLRRLEGVFDVHIDAICERISHTHRLRLYPPLPAEKQEL
jgi:hypothetical protein